MKLHTGILIGLLMLGVAGAYAASRKVVLPSNLKEAPGWVRDLARQMESGFGGTSIRVNEYRGGVVYHVTKRCCDQFNPLFDAQGKVICNPDGGLTGRGDSHCPDYNYKKELLLFSVKGP
jgi:hypothetical protein